MNKMNPLNFLNLFKKSGASVVVEIGTDCIKILQILTRKKQTETHLKTKSISEIREPLREAIPKILKEVELQSRHVTTYLPRNMVNLRLIEIPSTEYGEIDDIVKMQAVKQTPYSRNEVVISYAVTASRKEEGYSDVVIAFCQRKFVDERLDILENSGLKVDRIGISSEGLLRWYLKRQKENGLAVSGGVVMLVDPDTTSTDVVFCKNGSFAFSRGFSFALTDPAGADTAVRYGEELKRVVKLTLDEAGLDSPEKAVLAGPVGKFSCLREKMEEVLEIPVELMDPAMDMDFARGPEESSPSITSLVGFGNDGAQLLFDLTPEEVKLKHLVKKRGKQLMLTGALSLALIAAVLFFIGGDFYKRLHYISELEKNIERTSEAASDVEGKVKKLKMIQNRTNADKSFLKYLKEISASIPHSVHFDSLDYMDGDKIILKGYAGEMSEVFEYAKALENLKIFKTVKSEQVSKKKMGDKNMSEFEIVCGL